MMEKNGIARATRRIQALTAELERLGDNPMLDPDESQATHKEIWDEIKQLNDFVRENIPARKSAASRGRAKHGQHTFAS
jgi:plasmid stabilization system protein ParE